MKKKLDLYRDRTRDHQVIKPAWRPLDQGGLKYFSRNIRQVIGTIMLIFYQNWILSLLSINGQNEQKCDLPVSFLNNTLEFLPNHARL